MNDLIKHLQVSTTVQFDVRGNANPITQYSYYVLDHGPFVERFAEGTDTPEAVKAAFQKRIDALRSVGALPAGS